MRRLERFTIALLISVSAASAQAQAIGVGRYQDASGLVNSGECANYSEWYSLSTRLLKPGHEIMNFGYSLRGDRKCGDWSNCEVVTDTATEKTVRFRMQGHSENCGLIGSIGHPNNGTAQSEMVFTYEIREVVRPHRTR